MTQRSIYNFTIQPQETSERVPISEPLHGTLELARSIAKQYKVLVLLTNASGGKSSVNELGEYQPSVDHE